MPGFVGIKGLGVDLTDTTTTAQHQLGARVTTDDGKTYVYVRADATGHAIGDSLSVTSAYVTTTGALNAVAFGIADKAVAANAYFWAQVGGQSTVAKVSGTPTSGTLINRLSAATGQLQAVAAAGDGARGVTQSAVSGGVATVYLYVI